MTCLCRDGFSNSIKHSVQIAQHKLVWEAQNREPLAFQPSIALRIAETTRLGLVRLAIQFDDQACGGTEEIGNVWRDRNLPPELQPVEAPGAHLLPDGILGAGVESPLLAGEGAQARIGLARTLAVQRYF